MKNSKNYTQKEMQKGVKILVFAILLIAIAISLVVFYIFNILHAPIY